MFESPVVAALNELKPNAEEAYAVVADKKLPNPNAVLLFPSLEPEVSLFKREPPTLKKKFCENELAQNAIFGSLPTNASK